VETGLKPDKVEVPFNLARKYFYMMMNLYQKQTPVLIDKNIFNGYIYKSFNAVPDSDDVVRIIRKMNDADTRDFIFWDR
jgi:hypothetical protein